MEANVYINFCGTCSQPVTKTEIGVWRTTYLEGKRLAYMKCDVYIRKKNYHRDQYIYIDFCVTCSQYNIPKKKRYMKSGTGDLAKEPFKRDLYIRPKALQMHKRGPHIRKRDLCGFRLRVGQETRPKRLTTAKGLYKRDLHVLKRDLHIRKRGL